MLRRGRHPPTAAEQEQQRASGEAARQKSMQGYCEEGGSRDPICDVTRQADSVQEEIHDVFHHIKEMLRERAEERAAAGRDATPARERETEEAVEAERTQVARGDRKDSEGTWAELRAQVPWFYPNEDAGFTQADRSADGHVSEREFVAFAKHAGFTNGAALWTELGDGDGQLSRQEFAVAFGDLSTTEVKAKLLAKFGSADKAWGRRLEETMTLAQFEEQAKQAGVPRWNAQRVYAAADVSKDGELSCDEFMAAFGTSLAELAALVAAKHESAAGGFAAADKDGSEYLTGLEFSAQATALGVAAVNAKVLFQRLDLNGDDFISQVEYGASDALSTATVAEFKAKLLAKYGTFDAAWEAAVRQPPLTEDQMLAWAEQLGYSNGAFLFKELFHGEEVTHRVYALAMGAAVTMPKYKAAALRTFFDAERCWASIDRAGAGADGRMSRAEFREHAELLGIAPPAADDLFDDMRSSTSAELVTKAEYLDAMRDAVAAAANQARNVAELRDQIAKLDAKIADMKALMARLQREGELDVALEARLSNEIAAMEKFRAVAAQLLANELAGTRGSSALAEKLQETFTEVDEADAKLADVAPGAERWWRYAYEYLFVQSALLVAVLLIFFLVSFPLHALRRRLDADQSNLFHLWLSETGFVVMTALVSGGLLFVAHHACVSCIASFLHVVITLLPPGRDGTLRIRTPETPTQWLDMLIAVYLYLCVALVLFVLLMRQLVSASEEKKSHWAQLDKLSPRNTGAPSARRRTDTHTEVRTTLTRIGRKPTMFGGDIDLPPEVLFDNMRQYFISHLLDPKAPLHRSLLQLHGAAPTEERVREFRLSWYFRENVDLCIVQLVTLGGTTWLFLAAWFLLLGFLAAVFHVTYMLTMFIVGATSFSVLVFMYYTSMHRRNTLESIRDGDVTEPDDVTGHVNFSSGLTLDAMRCFIVVLLYGAVQFLMSNFCWTYYPVCTGVFAGLVLCFLGVWCVNWVYIVPVYAAAMSLPPFYAPAQAHLHAEHITAALQDDAEWASEEEAAEAGLLATPRLTPREGEVV